MYECIPPPSADIFTCTEANGVKKKNESQVILSFSGFLLPSSQRGKTSLTFYKLGGAGENLLGK